MHRIKAFFKEDMDTWKEDIAVTFNEFPHFGFLKGLPGFLAGRMAK